MSVLDWSTTAANNDVADPAINWAENQSAASVNNSSRAMMAMIAKYVKDTGGALVSTGSSNAYAVTTNSSILAHAVPVFLAFRANHSSTGAATIAVDALASKPLKRSNGAAIQSGDIVSGSVYLIAYQASADVYMVLNVSGNYDPTAVAITGGTIDGVTITLPNTGLHILDTNASHDLIIAPGSNITADRTLTITTGDANRILTLTADLTVGSSTTLSGGTHSGTNTGDQTISLTGDVTGSGTGSFAATIANDAVTNAKAANMAQSTIKGRAVSAGTGDPTDLTATQATAILNAMVGDSGSGGTKGLVPAPASGDATKFLRGDATFATAGTPVDYQAFTSSGTWSKPSGTATDSRVFIEIWGAGGGGSSHAEGGGAGGGGYNSKWFLASDLGSTETVTIATGGSIDAAGGNSTFGSLLTGYGGGGSNNARGGGGGAGTTGAGTTANSNSGGDGGAPRNAVNGDNTGGVNNLVGGGAGCDATDLYGGWSVYGGGGGAGAGSPSSVDSFGGSSVFGGGGGGGAVSGDTSTGGTSVYGGAGGATGVAGTAPAGGGGRNAAGGRGECRVTTFL